MKSRFVLILLLGSLLACNNVSKKPAPENLIPEEKMISILLDVAKIDAAISYNRKKFTAQQISPKKYIYQKYQIDSAQLAESSAYYIDHHKVNTRIYEAVKERLKAHVAVLDSLKKKKENEMRTKKEEIKPLKNNLKKELLNRDKIK